MPIEDCLHHLNCLDSCVSTKPQVYIHDRLKQAAPIYHPLVLYPPHSNLEYPLPLTSTHISSTQPYTHSHPNRLTKWSKQYGPVISLINGPFAPPTIALTSRHAIRQLLDRRGAHYADRPDSYVLTHLITRGQHLLPMRYGERWRKLRRVVQQELSEARCDAKHRALQHAESVQMLADFLQDPAGWARHPKRFGASVMTSVVTGMRIPHSNTRFLTEMDKLFYSLVSATVTGACPPVDTVPAFKYLPDAVWNRWRSRAVAIGDQLRAFYGGLIDRVRARRSKEGGRDATDSEHADTHDAKDTTFIDHVLSSQEKYGVSDSELIFLVGTLLEGGSDTSSATLQVFLEAIFKHPAVQARAHAQLDSAGFGPTHMPSWTDYDALPYISQIIKETIRWRAISPTAFPHATGDRDDEYELPQDEGQGPATATRYRIPARSTIIVNVYGLHRDERYFPDPDAFDPDRFEGLTAPAGVLANAADPETGRDHYGYGAGRRICPGIHLAERNLFIAVARLLWAFEFERVEGGEGKEAVGEGEGEVFDGPAGMRCRIRVRGEKRRQTILAELQRAQTEVFARYEEAE